MSIDTAIREGVLALVPELVAAIRAELGRPRMLPLKQTPVAYRALLEAERRGELVVYRVGHSSLVDESDLWAWVKRVGAQPPTQEPVSEAAQIIAANAERRRGRRAA